MQPMIKVSSAESWLDMALESLMLTGLCFPEQALTSQCGGYERLSEGLK